MEYALIENIQRVNLNTLEEAEGYALLKGKYNFTQEEIAKKFQKADQKYQINLDYSNYLSKSRMACEKMK